MEEFLILFFQGVVEILFQVLGSGLLDLLSYGDFKRPSSGCTLVFLLFIGGCLLGWLSLLLVPHSLMPWAWLRIANLFMGPLLSGYLSWWIAQWRQRRDPKVVPLHHAVTASVACLGLIIVRFTWGVR